MTTKNFVLENLRSTVLSGETNPIAWRLKQLQRFSRLIEENEEKIIAALKLDLGKPATEAFFEIIALRQELKTAEEGIKNWCRPQKIKVPLSLKPGEAWVQPEPKGCILIIGPWNYPFSLTLQPLISALTAGNTAVLKPSEQAPATANLIEELIKKYFPENVVQVQQGGGETAAKLVQEKFDHIFFTGGGEIGKKILKGSSSNLTPVTLELGGKSPAIVIEGADITITARRLIWGKSLNSGQTCVAPDHVFILENLVEPLINEMRSVIKDFYGEEPIKSKSFSRIINKKQFERIKNLLDGALAKNQIVIGGNVDEINNLIEPTIIKINNSKDPLMESEIFGPLLPIIPIKNLNEAIIEIKNKPKPLALYQFGGTEIEQKYLLENTSSGTVCFNDVIVQVGIPELPFGGIGGSGMGRYHGIAGFLTFSNQKSILKRPFWLDLKFRYPPYKLDLNLLKKLLG